MVTRGKPSHMEEIGELCDDLMEHIEEGDRDESVATAERILAQVKEYFQPSGDR
ncbi:MAG: hypothetical protein U0821_17380 [Chloroflexota bacterium]